MNRQDLRNPYPFHDPRLATTLRSTGRGHGYNRHSFLHRLRASWARVRRLLRF